MLNEMAAAVQAMGLRAKTALTDAGPVIVVDGPKGQIGCLVTESRFSITAWAESIKARLT